MVDNEEYYTKFDLSEEARAKFENKHAFAEIYFSQMATDAEIEGEDILFTYDDLLAKLPSTAATHEQAKVILYQAINRLDAKRGAVVRLFLKGFKEHEIAKQLGVGQSNVSQQLKIAITQIKQSLLSQKTKQAIDINTETQKKICGFCHRTLPYDAFYADYRLKDNHATKCIECYNAGTRKYKKRTPAQIQEDLRRGSKVCKTCNRRQKFDKYAAGNGPDHCQNECKKCTNKARSMKNKKYNAVKKTKAEVDAEIRTQRRVCKSCKVRKPFAQYYKNKNQRAGIESICKDCQRSKK